MFCPSCGVEAWPGDTTCVACGSHLTVPSGVTREKFVEALQFAPGESFAGRYTIVEEIGSGGQAHVFKAIERGLQRTIALKLIPPAVAQDAKHVGRFKRELTLAQQVTHPNVCRLHDIGEAGGIHYISMEYIDGHTLRDWVQAVGHLSPQQTIHVGRQICAGLTAIHEQAITHRDLKPHNVMLDRSGRVVVMDFGLARRPDVETLTGTGEALGTFAYLSPEQARGKKVDPRSDIYALGLILFEMLTGRRPPGDEDNLPLALRDTHEKCPPPSRLSPEVPSSLDAIVLRCLEREPAARFASATEVRHALDEAAGSLSSSLGVLPAAPPPRVARGLHPAARWLLGAALAVVAVLVIRYTWIQPAQPRSEALAIQELAYEGPVRNEYLSHLLPVALERALRAYEGLELTPYESSRTFSVTEEPVSVARQLGVGHVVRGHIRVEGSGFEASFRLVSSEGGEEWTADFANATEDVLDVVEPIAEEIAGHLDLRRVSSAGPPAPRAMESYLEGKESLEGWDVEKNYERAEEAFRRAVQEDDDFAEAHAGLARALWKQYEETRRPELVESAFAAATRAVSLRPELPEVQLALGEIQLGRGQSAEAAASFAEAQRLAPADDAVCRRIADAYAALGRNELAEEFYARAISLRPTYWENYNLHGYFLLQTGELERAKESFRRVVRLRPESEVGYSNLATVHLLAGEIDEAEPLLKAAQRIHPTFRVHNNLGFVYYSTGRFESAVEEFRRATELSPNRLEPYGNLGDALRQLGRPDEARTAYRRAIELGKSNLSVNPNDALTRAGLSMYLAGSGQCNEATDEAVRAVEGASDNPTVSYYVAVAHAICDDRMAALRHTLDAIRGGVVADVRTNPDLQPLLGDPAVQQALR